MPLLPYIESLVARRPLSRQEAQDAMRVILEGKAGPAQMAAFLTALRMNGETVEELVGFARALRERAVPVHARVGEEPLLDTCGTGGDGAGTFNISTIAAFVVAGAGVHVAKHGNRSISSRCGSADVLEQLGVKVNVPAEEAARAIREIGIGFIFAPAVHTATGYAQPVRRELRMRTVFNLLGPLTNPAGATAQLAGAPSPHAAELIAGALAELGLEHGFVVHGSDGLDEITTTGSTLAFEIRDGKVTSRTLEPADFAVPQAQPADLRGGDPAHNAGVASAVLAGERGPARDVVIANAAAGLVAAGKTETFLEGAAIAAVSLDSGAARGKLEELVRFTAACRAQ